MNIKKVKSVSGSVIIDYSKENGVLVTETSKVEPHPDFNGALSTFKEPFLFSLNLERDFNDVKISGIELKETKSGESVVITGSFKDRKGSFIGLACKPISFEDEDFEEWDLPIFCENAIGEATKYLVDGKKAQTEMDFPDESDNQ